MLKMAVCDDERAVRQQVCEFLQGICERQNIGPVIVEQFASAQALLDDWPGELDVLFMDIQMPGLSGMDAAREIRTFDENVTLVFMTNYAKYAVSGYSVQAYNFLLKPLHAATFDREVTPVLKRLNAQSGHRVTFRNETDFYTLATRDIVYIETSGKCVLVHTLCRDYRAACSMKSAERQMPEGCFFRVHTGYLVNMDYVTAIERDELALKTGQRLPVSRHRKRGFVDAYMTHMGRLV